MMRHLLKTLAITASLSLASPLLAIDAPPAASPSPQVQYDEQGRYVTPQAVGEKDEVWKDENGQLRCKRKNGTTGLVIGAVVGGLFGNTVFGGDAKALGTILGAVGGGLLGRSIEKGEAKCQ